MIEVNEDDMLRRVDLDGYRLELWDTNNLTHNGKPLLGYRLTAPANKGGEVIFEGTDFGCAPSVPIDSDTAIRELMGFLTLKPGDTDREYFENYTPRQLAFCENEADDLRIFGITDPPGVGDSPLPEIHDLD